MEGEVENSGYAIPVISAAPFGRLGAPVFTFMNVEYQPGALNTS
jgi:hypothetical protein